mmetsp:Transcript_3662/g.4058  ORF Transcript_3662/g.4058 Transcript_3662/m.4058 type:complete len:244 (-) Transcript_3662:89-820(-)
MRRNHVKLTGSVNQKQTRLKNKSKECSILRNTLISLTTLLFIFSIYKLTTMETTKTKTVWFIRHGQAEHNLRKPGYHDIPDPVLTPLGVSQVKSISVPNHIEVIITSPFVRTLQTTMIGLESLIKSKPIKIIANPDIQERNAWACDTGSPKDKIAAEFPSVDFSLLPSNDWYKKEGDYVATDEAVEARLGRFLVYLEQRPESAIAVVAHHGVLKVLFDGLDLKNGEVQKRQLVKRDGRIVLVK